MSEFYADVTYFDSLLADVPQGLWGVRVRYADWSTITVESNAYRTTRQNCVACIHAIAILSGVGIEQLSAFRPDRDVLTISYYQTR
jgi:hypothetical protein